LITVFTGLSADEQVMPRAIVSAMTGREQPQGSGNFMVDLAVQVLSKADDSTIEEHRTLCISTIGLLVQDDVAAQLSSIVPDFHVFGFTNRTHREVIEDRAWVTEFSAEFYCAGLVLV
jgi:hypothetical protein